MRKLWIYVVGKATIMKKTMMGVFLLAICLCLVACSNKSIEGTWYAVPEETMVQFTNGVVKIGGQPTGQYEKSGNKYIVSFGGMGSNWELYTVDLCGTTVLSTSPDRDGVILYCRNLEKIPDIVDYIYTRAEEANKTAIPNAKLVTYDSIVEGCHTNELVALEAVICSYQYETIGYKGYYDIGLAYWSDEKNKLVYDEFPGSVCVEDIKPDAAKQLSSFDVGDKIKIILRVYEDDSFGLSGYIWADLIEKSYLK